MELIIYAQPKSILDIGVGFGKYGFLSREYLELFDGREKLWDWKIIIDGIEIFQDYITPLHKMVYNQIDIGNVTDILPALEKKYDLILLIDVIEHLNFDEGEKLIEMCQQHAKNVIISTPRYFMQQPEMFGNPFEAHKSFFKKKHFKRIPNIIFIPNMLSLIVYMGDNAKLLGKILRRKRVKWAIASRLGLLKYFNNDISEYVKQFISQKK
ncbi:hypothetical protein ACFL6A_02710 [bacterium]